MKRAAGIFRQPEFRPGQVHNPLDAPFLKDPGKDSIVRPDEYRIVHRNGNGPTLCTHPRIDNGQVDGPLRKVGISHGQAQARGPNVLGGNFMRQIDNPYGRRNADYHAFQNSRINIPEPEVRQKGYDAAGMPFSGPARVLLYHPCSLLHTPVTGNRIIHRSFISRHPAKNTPCPAARQRF
jgi:hypothetical protein